MLNRRCARGASANAILATSSTSVNRCRVRFSQAAGATPRRRPSGSNPGAPALFSLPAGIGSCGPPIGQCTCHERTEMLALRNNAATPFREMLPSGAMRWVPACLDCLEAMDPRGYLVWPLLEPSQVKHTSD